MSFVIQCRRCLTAASVWVIVSRADSALPAQFLNPHQGGSELPELAAATAEPLLREEAGCCEAKTADCIACSKGISKEELCRNKRHLLGCSVDVRDSQQQACCEALTAACIACSRGIGEKEVCEDDPHISGCPQPALHVMPITCCDAMTADCVACRIGISVQDVCRRDVHLSGCSSFRHSGPKPKVCCKALVAECIACNRGLNTKTLCQMAPHTAGCRKQVHDSGMLMAEDVKRARWMPKPWLLALHVATLVVVCGGLAMAIVCGVHLQRAQQARAPLLTTTAQLGDSSEDTVAVTGAAS